MEPTKRSSAEPLPPPKVARGNSSYFDNPSEVTVDKLLETAKNALEQLKTATRADRPQHERIVGAVRMWAHLSLANKNDHRFISNVFPIFRQILTTEGQFRGHPQSRVTVKMDLFNFSLNETQVELLNVNSRVIHEELVRQATANPGAPIVIKLDEILEREIKISNLHANFKIEIDDLPAILNYLEKGEVPNQENAHFAEFASLLGMPFFGNDLTKKRALDIYNLTDATAVVQRYTQANQSKYEHHDIDMGACLLQIVFLKPQLHVEETDQGLVFKIGPKDNRVTYSHPDKNDYLLVILEVLALIQNKDTAEGFNKLEKLNPLFLKAPAPQMLLFHLHGLNSQFKKSDRIIDRLNSSYADHAMFHKLRLDYYLKRVSLLKFDEKFDKASEIVMKILKEEPENCDFLLQRAKIQNWKTEDIKDIIGTLEGLLAIDPNHKKALIFYADMLGIVKRFPEKLEILNKLIKEHYKPYKTYAARGELWLETQRYNEALADFLELPKLNPKNHEGYSSVAETYLRMKNYKEAVHWVKLAENVADGMTVDTSEIREQLPKEYQDMLGERELADEFDDSDEEDDDDEPPIV